MHAVLTSPDFGTLRVLSARGRETMHGLSAYFVEAWTADEAPPAVDDLVGVRGLLVFDDQEIDAAIRRIGVIVVSAGQLPTMERGVGFRLELAPDQYLLTERVNHRVFQDLSVPDIVAKVLLDGGFAPERLVQRLQGSYAVRPYCVQYGESDWAFVLRLLADEGIGHWFDFRDDTPVLVLGDHPQAHDTIDEPTTVLLADPPSALSVLFRSVFEVADCERVVTTGVHVREYDVRRPALPIDGKAGDAPHRYFEYPANVADKAQANTRAQIRLEQLQRFSQSSTASTDSVRLHPGRVFDLARASDADMNCRHLVAALDFEYLHSFREQDGAFRGRVVLQKERSFAFRPDRPRHRPRVRSVEPAITTGPSGQEIHVNDLGDLKVRFHWDRSGVVDDKSSTWVRLLQTNMAGSMVLPRVGWEVPVTYVDGNPDRPVVLGRLYNGQNVVPYGLPGAKTTSTIQSATSPADGTTNEVRLGDAAGGMEFFIHSTRDQSVFVGGSSTRDVSASDTHDVGLSLAVAAKTQSYTVSGAQKVDIGTDYITKVGGARSEMVGGMDATKLVGNRSLVVQGGYIELVGALYGLQCNQSNTDVTGIYTQMIGGSRLHVAPLGTSESVAGARAQATGGSRHIISSRSFGESVRGVKNITAGASSLRADAAVMTTSSATGTTTVGGNATIKATGPLVISGAEITIDVSGNITAESITIGGGTFKLTAGSSKLDGQVKRQGGTEIE